MKVVHAAKFYPPVHGGMETVIGDLCDGTAGEWDVQVVAANDSPRTVRERNGEVDVIRSAMYGSAASVPLCPALPWHLWTCGFARRPAVSSSGITAICCGRGGRCRPTAGSCNRCSTAVRIA
ncbi:MAG: hypothetical protein AUJ01_07155 [Acidobacteria bacterium 13_1_40CM_3_65_5]|nr:MAG: hypothetical protein AUJ01_07155 [Acidobacteria bacterium 13_1_40CM_3_65_5]